MSEISGNIIKCFAYITILIELSNGKKLTGYEIMVHLRNNFGFEVSPGTLYHQLEMLSSAGIIRGTQQSHKTVYDMTETGHEVFKKFKKQWKKPLDFVYQNLNNF